MTQTAHGVEFTQQPSATPKSAEERAAILANPGFGVHFTDHMFRVEWTPQGGWQDARIEPYGPLSLDPATAVLSTSLLLDHLGYADAAADVERAVLADLAERVPGTTRRTAEVGDAIAARVAG